jgi:hypothetical protein
VSEYITAPKTGVVPSHTLNVDAVIEFGSIGVLKVAKISFTVETLVDPAVPLVLASVDVFLTVAAIADSLALLILLRGTFAPPLAGDVRITVGATQTFTIPVTSSLQPPRKTTKSKAAVSPAESEMPRNPRIIREKYANRLKAVVGFVVGVFMMSLYKWLTGELIFFVI